ncbi:splicing factor, arginine/serine-rich 19-like [Pollicipes pollicipes]|nr:splicing factor, arginine/serine-rich 19-like [Pollicipes pollicipes]
MLVKEKFLKKLNRQERVVEEVKMVLKPYYHKRSITKDQYKEILGKSVTKICHSKSGEINAQKIQSLVIGYVTKFKYSNKKASLTRGTSKPGSSVKTKM